MQLVFILGYHGNREVIEFHSDFNKFPLLPRSYGFLICDGLHKTVGHYAKTAL